MITLIDNYDSFTYNLVHFLGELGASCRVYRNDKISVNKLISQEPKAIVISPGPCTPDDAGISVEIVKQAGGKIPVLGVCLGHQSIAQAFGAKIVRAPELMHGKLSLITHSGTGLFQGLPSPFKATRYHSLTILRNSLPDCFEITAQTTDGIIMGIAHKEHRIYGVQFHPESIASEHGHEILANFLKLAGVLETPHAIANTKLLSA